MHTSIISCSTSGSHALPGRLSEGPSNRTWRVLRAIILVGVTAGLLLGAGIDAKAASSTAPVVVSLTFDDGYIEHVEAAKILKAEGLRGTFFTPSGFVGAEGYMSVGDLRSLDKDGHEIGGHTVTHPDLTRVSSEEAVRQICDDRANLTHWGISVTSFAYPYAGTDKTAEDAARTCGYNSARGLDGVRTRFSCPECDYAETLLPANPFLTAAPQDVHSSWTLQDLKDTVINARPDGGWVQETFHHLDGDSSDELNFPLTVFREFVVWLAAEQAAGDITVKTVHQVIGGTVKPLASSVPASIPTPDANMLQNPGLEEVGQAWPRCWQLDNFGTNRSTLTKSSFSHSGTAAVTLTVMGFESGDSKVVPSMDLGECSPPASAGHTYDLKAWYKSDQPVHFKVFYRTGLGFWKYWIESPEFRPSSDFDHAMWTTPALPEGASSVSFGLSLSSDGALTSDDYEMYDGGFHAFAGPTAPPIGDDRLYDGMGWLAGIALLGALTRSYYMLAKARTTRWLQWRLHNNAVKNTVNRGA
jgi:peptidoglycan/xylan/chitin deacetylase (PgdA/CDA1 family)